MNESDCSYFNLLKYFAFFISFFFKQVFFQFNSNIVSGAKFLTSVNMHVAHNLQLFYTLDAKLLLFIPLFV